MIKQIITVVLLALTLTACQSTPEPLSLNPVTEATHSGQSIVLNVRDQRAQNHVLRLERHDNPAEFAMAEPSLASLISDRVSQRWTIDEQSSNKMQINIKDGLVIIKQGTLRHDSEHHVRIQVQVTTAEGDLEKTFRGRRESDGPLRADISAIENDFANLLADVLNDLMRDEIINSQLSGQ
ncbi:hypothetical protein CWE09_05740 [Aliidiomarina minuta]|uniref:ABC-type transport auxiliary lipoprotein component domain-containing protein n=1 Tax=Aliidiomarina minuta TaxID=880057 RepID=A0A432W8C8_9GAMM|nr:YajG family lipoprotein [Aliidiomarina minuta]RUO26216.1 hypothetical protein CWE09_05740 [Aliidiomarina minuta]